MGSSSMGTQLYYLHHQQQEQEEEYYNNSMRFDDEEEEDENELASSTARIGTGYLEDVVFDYFTSKSKRRRLLHHHIQPLFITHCQTNPEIMTTTPDGGKESSSSPSPSDIGNNNSQWTPHYAIAAAAAAAAHDSVQKGNLYSAGVEEKRKKGVMAKVVYPFTLVKPGGFEGDDVATLNDINERILMPPTRPVRHPVGDFACRPLVSPKGPGLSGKTVVAFTRVHTQGRGTITIIRTRG